METNKKLKAKDLINVGIYTAIYIVIFFVRYAQCNSGALSVFVCFDSVNFRYSVHAVSDEN